jgi:hypothetical protein
MKAKVVRESKHIPKTWRDDNDRAKLEFRSCAGTLSEKDE